MHLRTYLQFSQIIYVIRYNLAIPTKNGSQSPYMGNFLKGRRPKRRSLKKRFGFPRIYTYIYRVIKVI